MGGDALCPDEHLGRCVTAGSDDTAIRQSIKQGLPRIPPTVFEPWGEDGTLSVIRIDRADGEDGEFAVRKGIETAKRRGVNRRLHGWAVLDVTAARRTKCEVRATPQADNRWHADIEMPSEDILREERREEYSTELARASEWRENLKAKS